MIPKYPFDSCYSNHYLAEYPLLINNSNTPYTITHLIIKPKIMNKTELISSIQTHQFIVGSQDSLTNHVSFSPNPTIHLTSSAARAECKRLANLLPGKLYFFVELAGAELVPNNTISI